LALDLDLVLGLGVIGSTTTWSFVTTGSSGLALDLALDLAFGLTSISLVRSIISIYI
jgi:hypothetical protein